DIVERAIELFGAPIYVRHEVVHNRHVVERLRSLGAVFVEELLEVPEGATVIFSAHGRSEEHTSELQSLRQLVCRLLLETKKKTTRAVRQMGRGQLRWRPKTEDHTAVLETRRQLLCRRLRHHYRNHFSIKTSLHIRSIRL